MVITSILLLSPCFVTVSGKRFLIFAPQEMVIKSRPRLVATLRFVPPAGLNSWMLMFVLQVRGNMLTPSWGGVQPGGKGRVQFCYFSFGKCNMAVFYGHISTYTMNRNADKCDIHRKSWMIEDLYVNMFLPGWSDLTVPIF